MSRTVVDDLHTVRDATIDAKNRLYPDFTVDELLCHPADALKLCVDVRKATGKQLSDEEICKTLLNARKRGEVH